MQSVFAALVVRSVAMSALILLYIAVTPLLAKRYAAKGRYYAWLVIVLGLVIPFRPPLEAALFRVDAPQLAPLAIPAPVPGGDETLFEPGPFRQNSLSLPWLMLASFLWMAGAAAVMAYHALRHFRFTRMAKRWSEDITNRNMLRTLQCLKDELGIKRQVTVRMCHCSSVPMLLGFLRPVILLPPAIAASALSSGEIIPILKHELVHLKRHDLWYKGLVVLATAVHWFNPTVYFMAKAIAEQCEISCDERVMQGASFRQRKRYCETILRSVGNGNKHFTALSTNFIGGKKGMKTRMNSILDTTRKRTGITVLIVAVIATILAGTAFDNRFPAETGEAAKGTAREAEAPPAGSMEPYVKFLTTVDSGSAMYDFHGRWVRSIYDEKPNEKPVLYFHAVEDQDVAGKSPIHLRAIRNKDTGEIERLAEMPENEVFQLLGSDQVVIMAMKQAKGSKTQAEIPRTAEPASKAPSPAMESGGIETKDGKHLFIWLAGGASVQFGELSFQKGETFTLSVFSEEERALAIGIISISTGQVYSDLVKTGTGTVSIPIPEDGDYRVHVGNQSSDAANFELRLSQAIPGAIV